MRRPAAVAGRFYPAEPRRLADEVDGYLPRAARVAGVRVAGAAPPKAIIVPHAGYMFSGPIAGTGYATLAAARGTVRRVVILGPAHFLRVDGIATTGADTWESPLGPITIDDDARRTALSLPSVSVDDDAHAPEHSLEVHLPFLQRTLGEFTLLPLVVGHAEPAAVAAVLDAVWGGPETLVVVSSDLSHYLDHDTAAARDRRTADAIIAGSDAGLDTYDACGISPLRGLLASAGRHGLEPHLLDLRNSGDTAGPRDRVVGYGAFAFEPPDADADADLAPRPIELDDGQRVALLAVAERAVARVLTTGARRAPSSQDEPTPDPVLTAHVASFVTLERDGRLLGCVGSLTPGEPLAVDVARHAIAAAFDDPRVPAITADDYRAMSVKVSVLSALEPLRAGSFDDVLAAVRPGVDGLVVESPRGRATLLPSVWRQLAAPRAFVDALWHKAGLRPRTWPAGTRVLRYTTDEFADPGPREL